MSMVTWVTLVEGKNLLFVSVHRNRATTHYRQALDLYREVGDTYYEADTLIHLGDAHLTAGHADEARDALRQALTILDEFDDQHVADEVRAKLRSLDGS